MQYRKFGNTDLLVGEIGFGAWAIGGGAMIGTTSIGWGDADDKTSEEAIRHAVEAGINFFDTADIYGLGHSEDILGKTMAKNKEAIIATKVGNVARDGKFTVDYSKQYIISACEASLQRLKRETIDFYQLHSARMKHLEEGGCIEAMQQLQKQGKIRYWGLSLNTFEPAPEADYLMNKDLGNGLQLVLKILNQIALPVLQKATEANYGIIARLPLQFGLLTGKFDASSTFPSNDHRNKRLTKEIISSSTQLLQPVWKLCDKYGITKTQLALSYILSYPGVSTVIPGIRTKEHVINNTSGLVRLPGEDRQWIEHFGKTDLLPLLNMIQKQG